MQILKLTVGTPVGVASFFIIVHLDGDINLEKEKKGSLEPSNISKKNKVKIEFNKCTWKLHST